MYVTLTAHHFVPPEKKRQQRSRRLRGMPSINSQQCFHWRSKPTSNCLGPPSWIWQRTEGGGIMCGPQGVSGASSPRLPLWNVQGGRGRACVCALALGGGGVQWGEGPGGCRLPSMPRRHLQLQLHSRTTLRRPPQPWQPVRTHSHLGRSLVCRRRRRPLRSRQMMGLEGRTPSSEAGLLFLHIHCTPECTGVASRPHPSPVDADKIGCALGTQ